MIPQHLAPAKGTAVVPQDLRQVLRGLACRQATRWRWTPMTKWLGLVIQPVDELDGQGQT